MEDPPIVAGRPLGETVWRRAGSDTWQTINSAAFWTFGLVMGLVTAAVGEYATAIAAQLIFVGTIASVVLLTILYNVAAAPFKQRDEARSEVVKLSVDDATKIARVLLETPYDLLRVQTSMGHVLLAIGDNLARGASDYEIHGWISRRILDGYFGHTGIQPADLEGQYFGVSTVVAELRMVNVIDVQRVVSNSPFQLSSNVSFLNDFGAVVVQYLRRIVPPPSRVDQ